MDTPDTVDSIEVKKKPGRPAKKQDPASPLGSYIADQAKATRESKKKDTIVNKYYELSGSKLILCKQKQSGSVFKTLVGSKDDKKNGAQLKEFIDKLQKEGKLRVRI